MTRSRQRNGLWLYFPLACIPPWIGWSLLVSGVVPQNSPLSGLMFLTGEAASLAGVIATLVSDGRAGVSDLMSRAVRIKAPIQWWIFSLVVPQIWFAAAGTIYLVLHQIPVVIQPSAWLALTTPPVLVPFLLGPLGEEFGWRGFLLPRLMERFAVLPACILLGIFWAAWHWPLFWKNIMKSPASELFFLFANVAGLCILICTVYLRTGSLLLAMLTHWSSNAAQAIVGKLLPGLPDSAHDTLAFKWCEFGVLMLIVLSVAPALLRADRRSHRGAGAAANGGKFTCVT